MSLLAIDPGIRGCGVALFDGAALVRAAYVRNQVARGNRAAEARGMAMAVDGWVGTEPMDQLAVEWPQVYMGRIRDGSAGRKDANDLLALCGVDVGIACRVGAHFVASYLPAEWKGQMSKEACHHRIASRLSITEQQVLADSDEEAGALAHNVWDAVGIGLHHLGRLKPRRVIPS